MKRYEKQILYSEIGIEGQEKLLSKRIIIIGCGGLGSIIANNLTRAGVGFIRIIDPDYVETSNLQRQVLFDEEDVEYNLPKAIAAENKLKKINSSITIEAVVAKLDSINIEDYCRGMDIIIDGTDNFKTRYLINDTSIKLNIPWIYGGVIGSTGMVHTTIPHKTPCLRCMFPEIPETGSFETCHTKGVLNSITSIVGSLESTEAIKVLLGKSEDVIKGLQYIDIWKNEFELLDLEINKDCIYCSEKR